MSTISNSPSPGHPPSKIRPIEHALLAGIPTTTNVEFLGYVGKVTFEFSGMSGAFGRKTRADQFVVGLALMEKPTYTVVAEENMRRKNRKIPGACEKLRIPCITLKQFIKDEVK